jgi:hypothetical protein
LDAEAHSDDQCVAQVQSEFSALNGALRIEIAAATKAFVGDLDLLKLVERALNTPHMKTIDGSNMSAFMNYGGKNKFAAMSMIENLHALDDPSDDTKVRVQHTRSRAAQRFNSRATEIEDSDDGTGLAYGELRYKPQYHSRSKYFLHDCNTFLAFPCTFLIFEIRLPHAIHNLPQIRRREELHVCRCRHVFCFVWSLAKIICRYAQ